MGEGCKVYCDKKYVYCGLFCSINNHVSRFCRSNIIYGKKRSKIRSVEMLLRMKSDPKVSLMRFRLFCDSSQHQDKSTQAY